MRKIIKCLVICLLAFSLSPVSTFATGYCVGEQYPVQLEECGGYPGCGGLCTYVSRLPMTPLCTVCKCSNDSGKWCTPQEDYPDIVWVQYGSSPCLVDTHVYFYFGCKCDKSHTDWGVPHEAACGHAVGSPC